MNNEQCLFFSLWKRFLHSLWIAASVSSLPRSSDLVPLSIQRAPAREPFVVQGRGVTGQDDIAGQSLEQFQQLYVVLFLIVETVSAPRCTGVMEIGRIAVDQFATPVVILRQEPMSTVVDLLYRIVTFKSGHCPRVEVNANIVLLSSE